MAAAEIPENAAGRTTRNDVCILVEPRRIRALTEPVRDAMQCIL